MSKNPAKSSIEARGGKVLLRLRVQPRASRDSIRCDPEGGIRVTLTAPPVDGAANKALCAYIAKQLGIPQRAVHVDSGAKSRTKTVSVHGVSLEAVQGLLSQGQK